MRNLFFELLQAGNIKSNEGRFEILNAYQIILPVSVFLQFQKIILENFPSKAKTIFKEIGKYQFEQSFKRYDKLLDIKKIEMEKMIDFFMNHAGLMGFGKFNLIKFQDKPIEIILVNMNNPIATEYKILYGKSKNCIDDYFMGLLEAAYSRILNKNLECTETKCIAKGDKICQSEIREVKGKKKSKN